MLNVRLESFLDNALSSSDIPSDFLITGSWALRHHLLLAGIQNNLIPNDFDLIVRDDVLRRKKKHSVGRLSSGVDLMLNGESVDIISPEVIRVKEELLFRDTNRIDHDSLVDKHMVDLANLVSLYEYGLEDELDDEKREIRLYYISQLKNTEKYKRENQVLDQLKQSLRNSSSRITPSLKTKRRRAIPFSLE